MDVFGFTIPLWAFLIGLLLIVIVAWKFIKFALKILLVLVAFFVILIGLDVLGVFQIFQNVLSSFL
jgi:hypothetical protein